MIRDMQTFKSIISGVYVTLPCLKHWEFYGVNDKSETKEKIKILTSNNKQISLFSLFFKQSTIIIKQENKRLSVRL